MENETVIRPIGVPVVEPTTFDKAKRETQTVVMYLRFPRLEIATTIIFTLLKLVGVIGWGWPWVAAPLWIGLIEYSETVIVATYFILKSKNKNLISQEK